MNSRNCFVLAQHREQSEYNDFVGKYYHFPNKYFSQLSDAGPDAEFVYFEPTTKGGKGAYFGYGALGKIFEDKRELGQYFAEIVRYYPFACDVSFEDNRGLQRESGPSYNPQNSIRRIAPIALDEICLDGGIQLKFQADAHLIKVLGEELIASEVVGVLELIKNAYDAGASYCNVRIENIPTFPDIGGSYTKYPGPVIIIEDDGCGMDRTTIENGWMRPASMIKTNVKDRIKREKKAAIEENKAGTYKSLVEELKRIHKGRIPLGEKGVGRFATHRLGSKLQLITKTNDIEYEYVLEIDWDRLSSNESSVPINLDQRGFSLFRQACSRDYAEKNSGTKLIIFGGREGYPLTEDSIREINRSVLKLKSPKTAPENFQPSFECPQIANLDEISIEDSFKPSWSLDAIVDEDGTAEYQLDLIPPEGAPLSIFKENKSIDLRVLDLDRPKYWNAPEELPVHQKRKTQCGPFFIHIDIWYRSAPWVSGPDKNDFMKYLDNFGGISIYRDGLNIFPAEWGSEVDWLRLNTRHIKKGVKISYYNMIGNLEIQQTSNMDLIDKTDRQGLVGNIAFSDLSTLVRNLILQVIENRFVAIRKELEYLTSGVIRDPKSLGQVTKAGSSIISKIAEKYDTFKDFDFLFEDFENEVVTQPYLVNLSSSLKNLKKSLESIQEVQDLLSEQAGYGLAIAVAVHEISKITSNFYNGVTKQLRTEKLDKALLEELKESSAALKSELRRFQPYRTIRNETPAIFDIEKPIKFCSAVFSSKFSKEGIDFILRKNGTFTVNTRYGLINQVLTNLLDNSVYWLRDSKEKKIVIYIDGEARRVVVADSGPDINESIRPYLFEPGYSLKVPPSGLGLYISYRYMKSIKGDIHEAGKRDRLEYMPGAQFVLDFSRVDNR